MNHIPLFLRNFYCYQVKVQFRAVAQVEMSGRWYYQPRYALGNALKNSPRYSYLYETLFKPGAGEENDGRFTPIVVRADKPTRKIFRQNEYLDIYVTVITSNEQTLLDFLGFLPEWSQYGFFAENQFEYSRYQLFDTKAGHFKSDAACAEARLDYDYFYKIKPVWKDSLEIEFTTPTTLKFNGEMEREIPYHKVINRISEKCYKLYHSWLAADNDDMSERYYLENGGTTLYSRISLPKNPTVKKNKHYNLAGLVGKIFYDVPYNEAEALLLAIAGFIHIGNHTVVGNGQLKAQALESRYFRQYMDALLAARTNAGDVLPGELDQAIAQIAKQNYIPKPYRQVFIPKSNGGLRELTISNPTDLFLQKVLGEVLNKNFDNHLEHQSYAFRKGKSAVRAIRKIEEWKKRSSGDECIIRCDIDRFFDKISHRRLEEILLSKTDDPFFTSFVMLWVKNHLVKSNGAITENTEGVPQGSPVSPILANLYLDTFDEYVARHITPDFVRYADDIILCVPDSGSAVITLQRLSDFLKNNLSLSLNNDFSVTPVSEPFSFLGIRFLDKKLRMDEGKKQSLGKKIKKSIALDENNFSKIKERIVGYRRYYARLLDKEELAAIDGMIFEAYTEYLQKKPAHIKAIEQIGGVELPYSFKEHNKGDVAKLKNDAPRQSTDQILKSQKKNHLKELSKQSELVVFRKGAFVGLDKNTVKVTAQGQTLNRQKLKQIRQISIMSPGIGLSSNLIAKALMEDIQITFFNKTGDVYAVIKKPDNLLPANMKKQLELTEEKKMLFAVEVVKNKLKNQQKLLKYYLKYHNRKQNLSAGIEEALTQMDGILPGCKAEKSYQETTEKLFLTEARSAVYYWSAFRAMVQNYGGAFDQRVKQNAPDLINQMLNYGYAILESKVMKTLYAAQVSPNISYLHASKDNKPTLCFDLMEQYRTFVVDRSIIALLSKNEKVAQDKDGALDLETRKKIISKINDRMFAPENFGGESILLSELMYRLTDTFVDFIDNKITKPKFYTPKW